MNVSPASPRKSVTEAGLEAGYSGTSTFIAAFREHFGFTPSRLG